MQKKRPRCLWRAWRCSDSKLHSKSPNTTHVHQALNTLDVSFNLEIIIWNIFEIWNSSLKLCDFFLVLLKIDKRICTNFSCYVFSSFLPFYFSQEAQVNITRVCARIKENLTVIYLISYILTDLLWKLRDKQKAEGYYLHFVCLRAWVNTKWI